MPRAVLKTALICLAAFSLCTACGSREREASRLLMQATSLPQRGDFSELKRQLDKVISEYPDTDAANQATEMRTELTSRTNDIAKTVLQAALAASTGYAVSYPEDALSLQKIEQFGFQGMEGVEINFVRSDPEDFLIASAHVAGDQIYKVGRDGVIATEAK